MVQGLTKPVDCRCFHFKISDAMIAEPESSKLVNQVRVGDAQSQNSTLRAIKARAGHRYSLVVAVYKML